MKIFDFYRRRSPRRDADVIAVCNQKGGCAKTTTAINAAACLAQQGFQVLLIDLDPQAHTSLGLGVNMDRLEVSMYQVFTQGTPLVSVLQDTPVKGLQIAPANALLSGAQLEIRSRLGREKILLSALKSLKALKDFDYVIIDCSPSLNLITVNALTAADSVLVPVQTHYFSLEGMKELLSVVDIVKERMNPEIKVLGILPTIFDGRYPVNHGILAQIRSFFAEKVLNTVIREDVKLCEAPMYGLPIHLYAPLSQGAQDYAALAEEIVGLTRRPALEREPVAVRAGFGTRISRLEELV